MSYTMLPAMLRISKYEACPESKDTKV